MSAAEPWRTTPDGLVVTCRLTPKAGRDRIDGVADLADGVRVLLARVRSAPENGRANDALRELIADKAGVPLSDVTVTKGAKSRVKQLLVRGEPVALVARFKGL